jgi:hypothetical protein
MTGNQMKDATGFVRSAAPTSDEAEFVAHASACILDNALHAISVIKLIRARVAVQTALERETRVALGSCVDSMEEVCRVACELRLLCERRHVPQPDSGGEEDPHCRPTSRPPSRGRP